MSEVVHLCCAHPQQFATHLSVASADVIDVHGARRVSRDLRAKPISLLAAISEVELAKLVVGAIRLRRTGVGEEVGRHRDAAEFGHRVFLDGGVGGGGEGRVEGNGKEGELHGGGVSKGVVGRGIANYEPHHQGFTDISRSRSPTNLTALCVTQKTSRCLRWNSTKPVLALSKTQHNNHTPTMTADASDRLQWSLARLLYLGCIYKMVYYLRNCQ